MQSETSRAPGLDALKGMLVLVMVAYHVLSIATTGGAEAVRYLRFVSGSFIFVSGFVISRFLLARFRLHPAAATRALMGRGLKLLGLFTMLNLLIVLSGFGNPSKPQLGVPGFLSKLFDIYALGNPRLAAFLILLPIGYLLLISPVVLWGLVRAPRVAPLIVLLGAMALLVAGPIWHTVDLLLLGLCGMAAGAPLLAAAALGGSRWPRPVLIVALAGSVWATGRYGTQGLLYALGVSLILRFMHDILVRDHASASTTALALTGRYSLFAYVFQILVIQLLFRAMANARRWEVVGWEVAALGLLTAVLVGFACWGLERLRGRSSWIDSGYRWVFA